jgi:hypothetical protein
MAVLQDMDINQINEAIVLAAQRQIPATVTIPSGKTWITMHTRIIATRTPHIRIELPRPDEGGEPHEFSPAEKIGLSFKLKHHKHVCSVTVASKEQFSLDDGTIIPTLNVCWPTKMQRLQRRAYFRADVPPGQVVRASFWLGGRAAEPAGGCPERPVWSGRVTNLSAGGFQLNTATDLGEELEVGDAIGVRVSFGAARETIYADAQFRHVEKSGEEFVMGFQFAGLGQTEEGRRALDIISQKVSQYQHAAEKAANPPRRVG